MPQLASDSIRTHVLYDSITLGAAAVTASLFQIPRGQAAKVKYDTNMVQAGQVPKGKNFEILAVGWGWEYDGEGLIALGHALGKGHWELNVSDKVWAEGELFNTPMGPGYWASQGGAALSFSTGVNQDEPVASNLWTLEYGITLSDNEAFSVDFEWPAAPTAVKFWFMLYGREHRSLN